jgi:hypothetical protein
MVDKMWHGPSTAQMEVHGYSSVKDGDWSDSLEGSGITIGKWGCQWSTKYTDTPLSIRLADSISGTAMVLVVTIMLSVVIIVSASTLTRTRHKDDPNIKCRRYILMPTSPLFTSKHIPQKFTCEV